jgi:hypothetical protein
MPRAIVTGLTSYRYWDADGSRRFAGMGETVEVLNKEDFERGVSEGWIAPLPKAEASAEKPPKPKKPKKPPKPKKPKKPPKPKKLRNNKKAAAAPKDADQAANGEPVASEGAGEPVSQSADPLTPPE